MAQIGPLRFKRTPEPVRRQIEMASAAAWESVVDAHAVHAARFVALTAHRLAFDQALDRYLSEMDVRDPTASAVRSRVLVRLERAAPGRNDASQGEQPDDAATTPDAAAGLKRFRPDIVAKGIARKVRENEAFEEWVRLAIARAEEGVLEAHIQNAADFTAILHGHMGLDEAVEDYIDLMRITGGRAQSVYQRTMAKLADLHLPQTS